MCRRTVRARLPWPAEPHSRAITAIGVPVASRAVSRARPARSRRSRTGYWCGDRPEDIAPIVTFPATDGGWITGRTRFADGGYTTR
ncbi:hypothetical protein [Kitasatospora sp. NPDC059599]|uniref:hypothetical protein n=1 Tax=Kitasatospora sp. NPDC059599 TaxID=3346880 RepID=UPI00367CB531